MNRPQRFPFDQRILQLLMLLAVFTLAGCASGPYTEGRDYVDEGIPPQMRIAIAPFENLSAHPKAGIIVAQLMTTELYVQQVFEPMEETNLRRQLRESKVDISRLADKTYAQDIARKLKVDALMVGSVSEFGYQHGLHEEPTVGINARLIMANTGEVVWASSHSETRRGYLRRDSLNETAQRVTRRMIERLKAKLVSSAQ